MIIDCHGHYTTAPKALELFRKAQFAALTDPKVAYVAGPADAKVTVAEFFDYRCPHCKASMSAMKHLLDPGKKVRIAFIERPILTPDSLWAAQAAVGDHRLPGQEQKDREARGRVQEKRRPGRRREEGERHPAGQEGDAQKRQQGEVGAPTPHESKSKRP